MLKKKQHLHVLWNTPSHTQNNECKHEDIMQVRSWMQKSMN